MGLWQALRNRRSDEEERVEMYGDLLEEIEHFHVMATAGGYADNEKIQFGDFVGGLLVGYFLAREEDQYVLRIQCSEGLPGVSFLGDPVDSVEYCLTKKLSEARISAHRSDTNESVTISSRVSTPSFWKEIEGLSTLGMDELRRLIHD